VHSLTIYVLEWPLNGEEDDDFKITFANLPMVKGQFKANECALSNSKILMKKIYTCDRKIGNIF
jgi:hypothetical protein